MKQGCAPFGTPCFRKESRASGGPALVPVPVHVPVHDVVFANLVSALDHPRQPIQALHCPAHRVRPRGEVQRRPVNIRFLVVEFPSHRRVRERVPPRCERVRSPGQRVKHAIMSTYRQAPRATGRTHMCPHASPLTSESAQAINPNSRRVIRPAPSRMREHSGLR